METNSFLNSEWVLSYVLPHPTSSSILRALAFAYKIFSDFSSTTSVHVFHFKEEVKPKKIFYAHRALRFIKK